MSSPPPDSSPVSPLLADLWRRSRSDEAELARSFARFQRRAAPRSQARLGDVAAWMAAGMLVGMGTLYAATAAHERWHEPKATAHAAPSRRPTTAPPPQPAGMRSPPSQPPAAASAQTTPVPSGSASALSELIAPESWQRAARGLRESDFDVANDALLKLSRQGSPAERDIAKLVRAQVLMRQQRLEEARVILLELTQSTASATAREKSQRMLEHLSAVASSHRSFELDAGTDSP